MDNPSPYEVTDELNIANLTEAERFAAALADMPPRIRAFFEREDPVPWRPLRAGK